MKEKLPLCSQRQQERQVIRFFLRVVLDWQREICSCESLALISNFQLFFSFLPIFLFCCYEKGFDKSREKVVGKYREVRRPCSTFLCYLKSSNKNLTTCNQGNYPPPTMMQICKGMVYSELTWEYLVEKGPYSIRNSC